MNIGLIFPQTEFGNDPMAIRDYAQTTEDLGYTHVVTYDHVVGANPHRPGGWQGSYTYESAFYEPFVLFSYMAGITKKLGLVPGVIILPQRQTALAAKQAATLDVLSGGRLRLGVGLGWNKVEYIALAEDFHNRGRRMEEQITVLRQLWTQPVVNMAGQWHTIPNAGIKPLPMQQPVPIWFDGRTPVALSQAACLGDGWLSNHPAVADAQPALEQLTRSLDEAGRSRAEFGIEARLPYGDGNPATWTTLIRDWKVVGATHASLNTMGVGFDTPAAHLAALRKFAEAIGLV